MPTILEMPRPRAAGNSAEPPISRPLESLAGGLTLAGRWLPGLLGPSRRLRRFESVVQQQLADGHWVLVVHGVAWQQQTDVLALERSHSQRWCAVAPELKPLD